MGDAKVPCRYEPCGSNGIYQRPFQTNTQQRGVFNLDEWVIKYSFLNLQRKPFDIERLFLCSAKSETLQLDLQSLFGTRMDSRTSEHLKGLFLSSSAWSNTPSKNKFKHKKSFEARFKGF